MSSSYLYQNKYRTQTVRKRGWDYGGPGTYFVTICTRNRFPYFGRLHNGEMILNMRGIFACVYWHMTPVFFPHVTLDAFVVMPDHIHGILHFHGGGIRYDDEHVARGKRRDGKFSISTDGPKHMAPIVKNTRHFHVTPPGYTSRTLGSVIRGFKIGLTKRVGFRMFQHGYHDVIIHDIHHLQTKRRYIENNPKNG